MSSQKEEVRVINTLKLQIPASASNLGPGFDTLGLALNLYTKVSFDLLEQNDMSPMIKFKGAIASKSEASAQGNLIYNMLSELWKSDHDMLQRVRITIHSDIPLGSGLGSSDTALLGALWASYFFKGLIPTKKDLLTEGTRLEGYPENLAASLMGGLVVCARGEDEETILAEQLKWPEKWRILAVVPAHTLSTKAARAVLPAKVPFKDAVSNIQRSSLIVAAVANSSEQMLKSALHDKLHEPYREQLVPELNNIRRHLMGSATPVIGCVLSGGGSAVLVIVNQRHKDEVLGELERWAAGESSEPAILDLGVDSEGIKEVE